MIKNKNYLYIIFSTEQIRTPISVNNTCVCMRDVNCVNTLIVTHNESADV